MYRYETHLHTKPVSHCARATVRETLEFYKALGYAGVFITNHFLDGNINVDVRGWDYQRQIEYFCSDYEEGIKIGKELGISVFFGAELSYGGSDFLVYGLDKEWYLSHPEIMDMKKSEELPYLAEHGALVIHAHPFREAGYIDHIRLFPRAVHGVEIINANRTEFENEMAAQYAKNYTLLTFAGTDNHLGGAQKKLAGIETDRPIQNERDFVEMIKNQEHRIFFEQLD